MKGNIVILDYGMGNLYSVWKKLTLLYSNAIITSDFKIISTSDKIILPGVGHFQKAMENLNKLNLLDVLNEAVLLKKKPILGICLGMQLMANKSEEGEASGLGWIDADVVRFRIVDRLKYKIPHCGWNQIIKSKGSLLLKDIPELSEFYFVHSYHFINNIYSDVLTETEYEYRFPSAIEKGNIFGVQYHPEKSHDVGEVLLRNFVNL